LDELRLYRTVLATSGELIWSLDATARWTSVNAHGARRIYGREAAELIGRPFIEVIAPELRERDYAVFRRVLEGQPLNGYETRHLRSDGTPVDLSFSAVTVRDAEGRPLGAAGTARDISEHKRAAAALHESVDKLRRAVIEAERLFAFHDTLTGLPNRRLLDDRLSQAVALAQRRESPLAVLLLNLDGFGRINASLGHRTGDAVLQAVARRLAAGVRKADTLARHGGDEFVVVMSEVRSPVDPAETATRLLRALHEVEADGRAVALGASIGISLFPADARDGDALLRNAEAAMLRARELGPNRFAFYAK
jgi:diguanylate cyclase (GGDEF)-like protein/PAS domain S-box-containing protein